MAVRVWSIPFISGRIDFTGKADLYKHALARVLLADDRRSGRMLIGEDLAQDWLNTGPLVR